MLIQKHLRKVILNICAIAQTSRMKVTTACESSMTKAFVYWVI